MSPPVWNQAWPQVRHRPQLIFRADGRYEVRCPRCATVPHQDPAIGIGVPITNRDEAEGMVTNHLRDRE
jgi:hypothetical protein